VKHIYILAVTCAVSLLLSACAPSADSPPAGEPPALQGAARTATPGLPASTAAAEISSPLVATFTPTFEQSSAAATATITPVPALADESPPRGASAEFSTDFSNHTVPYAEILSGGPPKDGIPSIDQPEFVSIGEASKWIRSVEPVVRVVVGREARAYPLQVLIWHEIVNDTIGDLPLTVTFCPLCNTAIAFQRTFDGQVLDFGTTGRLRYSNLIMYDRQTETWWQQASGEGIAGKYAGSQLEFYPASIISWKEFTSAHPDGLVLSRQTGYSRDYGQNPYAGYDDVNNPPFLYAGPQTPGVLPPMARVLTVDLNGEAAAFPYAVLEDVQVINDTLGGQSVVVFWSSGAASALDDSLIAGGRIVGSAAAFTRLVDGLALDFEFKDDKIVDLQTGSEWNVLGQAVSGELLGKQLSPLVSINHFWFSWAAFKPETRVFQP
jgi:hypothetical protein